MDLFCEAESKLSTQIISKTKLFFLLHDGYPLAKGHLILIPRSHRDCFLHLSSEERDEFEGLKKTIIRFLTERIQEPVLFEHGAVAQTIPHAHLHFLPTKWGLRSQIAEVAAPMENPAAPYLYYEDKTASYFRTTREIPPGFLHTTFAKVLGRPIHGPDRAKEAELWILEVKNLWNKWLKVN